LANRHRHVPSHTISLIRSARLGRNTNTAPENGSAPIYSFTSAARPSMPLRKSIGFVATKTLRPQALRYQRRLLGQAPAPTSLRPKQNFSTHGLSLSSRLSAVSYQPRPTHASWTIPTARSTRVPKRRLRSKHGVSCWFSRSCPVDCCAIPFH
jgi:hypothetical protein